MSELVKFELESDVAYLTLNDPESYNALSLEMASQLSECFKKAEKFARAIVLTGEGDGFCSGAKLGGDMDPSRLQKTDLGQPLRDTYNPLMLQIRELTIPLVIAVNGAAAGIGFALATTGDIIVANEDAQFLPAFSRIGLSLDGGLTSHLVNSIGKARAMELALLDEKRSASLLREWGLINFVEPQDNLQNKASSIAKKLANGPTLAYANIRGLIWDATESSYQQQLVNEANSQTPLGMTHDHKRGVLAFLSKGEAKYTGN